MDNKRKIQKQKAARCLRSLDVYEPYIDIFMKEDIVTLFIGGIGYYIGKYGQFPELAAKIKEVEEKYGVLIYAVVQSKYDGNDMYSMLMIPSDTASIENSFLQDDDKEYTAWSLVWTPHEQFEIDEGDVGVKGLFGGIVRIW